MEFTRTEKGNKKGGYMCGFPFLRVFRFFPDKLQNIRSTKKHYCNGLDIDKNQEERTPINTIKNSFQLPRLLAANVCQKIISSM